MPGCLMIRDSGEIISADCLTINPLEARLDVSSLCQLNCVLCPASRGNGRSFLGRGNMPLGDFASFLDHNPRIRMIEIGNSGEVFLNPELSDILRYAYGKGVTIRIGEGANLNYAAEEALEALVKYRVSILRIAVDGATQETYQKYRVGGDLRKVLKNIEKINDYKKRLKSNFPRLILQFIPFGHNEHEIDKILFLAKALGTEMQFKLNVFDGMPPVTNHLRLTELIGYSDKDSYNEKTGEIYMQDICLQLWRAPQINWDGRLLGCSANTGVSYADCALGEAFSREINNEHIKYARKMLMGEAPPRDDIPCVACDTFHDYQRHNRWFTAKEITDSMNRLRFMPELDEY